MEWNGLIFLWGWVGSYYWLFWKKIKRFVTLFVFLYIICVHWAIRPSWFWMEGFEMDYHIVGMWCLSFGSYFGIKTGAWKWQLFCIIHTGTDIVSHESLSNKWRRPEYCIWKHALTHYRQGTQKNLINTQGRDFMDIKEEKIFICTWYLTIFTTKKQDTDDIKLLKENMLGEKKYSACDALVCLWYRERDKSNPGKAA